MKKFLIKLVLFVSPFIVLAAVELFVLPLDYFTFRAWEALSIQGSSIHTGQFYPNIKLHKPDEVGWLMRHSPYEVTKDITWITDKYGFRKRNDCDNPRVVIIGDSFAAGDALSHDEMLSEVLEDKLGVCVYPLAPGTIKSYLNDPRFRKDPPEVLILARTEDTVDGLRSPKQDAYKVLMIKIRRALCEIAVIRQLDVIWNRLWKANMLNYFRTRIRDHMGLGYEAVRGRNTSDGRPMFFRNMEPHPYTDRQVKAMARRLKEWAEVLGQQGTTLVFAPLPSKENIYRKYMPDAHWGNDSLRELLDEAKKAGVLTIDTKKAFETRAAKEGHELLYHTDDSHWTAAAAELTADLIVDAIGQKFADDPNEN